MNKKTNPILNAVLWIVRIAVGGLFIFSGLVKANDPKGLAYKMGEFFEAWAIKDNFLPDLMHGLNEYALEFAIIMIVLEIVAGIALILGYRFKFFSWIIFLLTAFFTFLTAYVLFSGNIKACGCFGDCIPLTPTETFTKDIILLILITILLLFRNKVTALFPARIANLVMLAGLILSIYMNMDVLKNLPYEDCLPYKVGNNIKTEMTPGEDYRPPVVENKLIYKNLKTGEEKGFTDLNKAPWADTLNWEYVDNIQTEISPAFNEPKILDFSISSYDGTDVTDQILNYEQNAVIIFIKDVKKAKTGKMADLVKLVKEAKDKNTPVIAVSPSGQDITDAFNKKHELNIQFYQIDGVVCKTAMRSNPGVMILNNGTVVGKWSYNNLNEALPFITKQVASSSMISSEEALIESDSLVNEEL